MSESINALSLASPESAMAFVDSLDFGGGGGLGVVAAVPGQQHSLHAPLRALFMRDDGPQMGVSGAPAATLTAKPAEGGDEAGLGVKSGIEQVYLVGSQLLSFNKEVTEERRAAAINSCLLAQLRASKLHPSPDTPAAARAWHATYVNTLTNIGWNLQSGITASHQVAANGLQVDKALLEILSVVIPGGAALTLVVKVLEKLAATQKDDPFITLYKSRTVEGNVVEFGAGLATGTDRGFLLSVAECAITVRTVQGQVLFFKWDASSASVDGRRFDLSISDPVFGAVKQKIEAMLTVKAQEFVTELKALLG